MATGCDISEHQASFPPGRWDFVIIRTVSNVGREDRRWRAHKARADALGIPAGAYVIVEPGRASPERMASLFRATLSASRWALVPWVDVELPGPDLRAYVARVRDLVRPHFGVVGGYYSAASSYRRDTADLFDRQWIAAWGSPYHPSYDLHQYRGAPLDLNYTPDLARIALGATPTPAPDPTPRPPRKATAMIQVADTDGKRHAIRPGAVEPIATNVWNVQGVAGVASVEGLHPLMVIAIMKAWGAWPFK